VNVLASGGGLAVDFQFGVLGVGLVLLVVWIAGLARGRNPLPSGPEPVATYRISDAVAVLLAWFGAQVVAVNLAYQAGIGGTDRVLIVKCGELVVVAAALVVWRVCYRRRHPHPAFGLAGVPACLAFLPIAFAVLLSWQRIYDAAGWTWEDQTILTELRHAEAWKFLVLAIVLAPITEEVVFRGVLHLTAKRFLGRTGGAIFSAAIFSAVHGSFEVAPAIFVLGLALAYVYERTGTLLAPMLFHATFNGFTVLGEFLKKGG
jgi:hypothetical protein